MNEQILYVYDEDSDVYIYLSKIWSRKSIKVALTGTSVDVAKTLNDKSCEYSLRLEDGNYVCQSDDFDVDDLDIKILRWVYKTIVEHIDFLLK